MHYFKFHIILKKIKLVSIYRLQQVVSSFKIERLTSSVELGEGPHWSVQEQKLYYVDLNGQKIMRYDPKLKTVTFAYLS